MFDAEFYPTPRPLIAKMVEPYGAILNNYKTTILEPSAGKGDICDYITKEYRIHKISRISTIEKDLELQHILQGKGYTVIDSDFLTYSSRRHFDLIIMNPPFSNGDEHLLKAWDVMKNGHIVCLLNKETIANPYSKRRRLLLSIIEEYGSVEYIGAAFGEAERKTNVEVALVRLKKTTKEDIFSFDGLERETFAPIELGEEKLQNQIAVNDQIGNAVIAYQNLIESFEQMAKTLKKIEFYASPFEGANGYGEGTVRNILEALNKDNTSVGHNKVYSILNQRAWSYIFNSLKSIQHRFTSKVQDDFYSFQSKQGEMAFSKENIYAVLDMLIMNKDTLMKKSVVSVFDDFTLYHKQNRIHTEGWKTNSHYKVNKKVILPNIMALGYFGGLSLRYSAQEKVDDIDKALCYVNGDQFSKITSIRTAIENKLEANKVYSEDEDSYNKTESTYFHIRFFMKGTLHLTFKDRFVWEQFNKMAVDGKDWLPEKY